MNFILKIRGYGPSVDRMRARRISCQTGAPNGITRTRSPRSSFPRADRGRALGAHAHLRTGEPIAAETLVSTVGFILIADGLTEHRRGRLIYGPTYLDIARTDGVLIVHILLSAGRTPEQKTEFYARAAELLVDGAGLRREDVTITLDENTRADWSFGSGIASYLTLAKAQWK